MAKSSWVLSSGAEARLVWFISSIEMILFIFSLRALLWLYLINLDAPSLALSTSQIGDRAFCLGSKLLQRWT